jgi:hypothetical protein
MLSVLSVTNALLTGSLDFISYSSIPVALYVSSNYLSGSINPSVTVGYSLSAFEFDFNLIDGPLPSQLGTNGDLQFMSGQSNMLSGPLPTELGKCTISVTITLSSNSISGTLAPELFSRSLTYLDLSENRLVGSIPEAVAECAELYELKLDSNQLSSTLPSRIGQDLLNYVTLQYNRLTGTVPPLLFGQDNPVTAYLYSNMLSGPLNYDLDLYGPLAFEIWLGFNLLTGKLPNGNENYEYMEQLNAQNNYFTGHVPQYFVESFSTLGVVINANFLSGSLPYVSHNSTLLSLICSSNLFNSTIPHEYETFASIYALDISSNSLTGTVPFVVFNHSFVTVLLLANNSFHGPLADRFGKDLQDIDVSNNQFTGPFPRHLGPALQTLALHNNQLTGGLSAVDCDSARTVSTLLIGSNKFSGDLSALACFVNVSILSADNCSFGGDINVLQDMPNLEQIIINGNSLSGTLPTYLGTLSSLKALIVANNNFYGRPDIIFNASVQTLLTAVDISSNDFNGPVPSTVFTLPALESFASIKTCFSGSLLSSICGCSNLKVLLMDGVTSGVACHRKFRVDLIAGSDAYVSTKGPLAGGIPTCIWNSWPKLNSLHLSSNGLTGTIGPVSGASNLTSVVLSYNQLSGTIPEELMSLPFTTLELSNDRFKGVVSGDLAYSNSVVYLQNNRLSGYLPVSFSNASQVSVMQGNLINCDKHHPKPAADTHSAETSCGSSTLNDSLFVWCGIAGSVFTGAAIAIAASYTEQNWIRAQFSTARRIIVANYHLVTKSAGLLFVRVNVFQLETYLLWVTASFKGLIPFESTSTSPVAYLVTLEYLFTFIAVMVVGISLMLCIPLFTGLKFINSGEYSTHTYQYQWLVSAAFMTGVPSAILVFLLWTVAWGLFVRVLFVQTSILRLMISETAGVFVGMGSQRKGHEEESAPSFIFWRYLGCTLFVIVHFTVMACVNAAYLYITLSGNYSVTVMSVSQVAVSVVKVLWDSFIIPSGIEALKLALSEPKSDSPVLPYVLLRFWCSVMTAVIIPFIVSLFVNSLCFLDLFIPQTVVNENFYYNIANKVECVSVTLPSINVTSPDGPVTVQPPVVTDCLSFGNVQDYSTEFYPPFSYSFQCGSGILNSYIPVLVYIFTFRIIALVVHRLWKLVKSRLLLRNSINTPADTGVANVETESRVVIKQGPIKKAGLIFCLVLQTLGVASAARAGVIFLYGMVEFCWHHCQFHKLFKGATNGDSLAVVDRSVSTSVKGLWRIPARCMWPSVHLASVFWSLMLFDMIGDTDAQHPSKAWCGPFIVCISPILLRSALLLQPKLQRFRRPQREDDDGAITKNCLVSEKAVGDPTVRSMTESVDNIDPTKLQILDPLPMIHLSTQDSRTSEVRNPLREEDSEHNSQFV